MFRTLCLVACLAILAAPAMAASTTVTQSHTTFDVDDATVSKGDTITFSNKDDVTHNIQIVDGAGAVDDKGLQKPGEDIKAVMATPGTYKVHCAIHPKMKMTVTVQ